MRLTLRTLLAYLDDILEPSQAKEIGDKLNESSFASSLVSRIREVMRRRRLTAPTLSGAGVGIDPNTVAEYLDNTLAPDGVADVEKICLESDVHLAEAAACHQILTLALGEPVEISPQTRERMYALGPAAAKMAVSASEGGGTNGMSSRAVGDILAQAPDMSVGPTPRQPAHATAPSQTPTIPDYLRPRSSIKAVLAYAGVAVVAICWVILMINNSPFRRGLGLSNNPGENVPVDVAQANRNKVPPDVANPPENAEAAAKSNDAEHQAAHDETETATSSEKATEPGNGSKRVASIDLPPPDEFEDETPPPRRGKVLSGSTKRGGPARAAAGNAGESGPEAESEPAPAVVPAPPPSKYTSSEGVTLNYVARDERWFMLPRRALVHAGDILAVPEPFHCDLDVDGGKGLVTIMGRSSVRVLEPTDAGAFGLEIKRGQFVVHPAGAGDELAASLKIGVGIAGELWGAEIGPGAVLGVQINLMEPTKLEQVLDKNAYLGAFYVASGVAVVTDPTGKTHEIKGPGWLQLPLRPAADGEGKPSQNAPLLTVPKWMTAQTLSTTAQIYARLFEKKFTLDEAVELSIPEVAADSNPETSRLATECLGLIEAYGPLVDILHRSQHEEARKSAITGLRLWLPRSADNQELLKAELAKRFPPEDADTVYKLLWGFDADDARNKVISMQLIDLMQNPEISIRELAFYHVARLTDKRHDYRPNGTPVQLKSAITRWRAHVNKEGALLPPQKPVPNPQ